MEVAKVIQSKADLSEACAVLKTIFDSQAHNVAGPGWWFVPVNMGYFENEMTRLFFDPESTAKGLGVYTENAVVIGYISPHVLSPLFKWAEEIISRSNGKDGLVTREAFVRVAKEAGAGVVMVDNSYDCAEPPGQEWRDEKMQGIGFKPWSTRYGYIP